MPLYTLNRKNRKTIKPKNHLLPCIIGLLFLLFFVPSSPAAVPDGDIAPLGAPDGIVNVGDALVALRFALGLESPTEEEIAHGDVAPLDGDGQPQPDGSITVGDALVILRRALGLVDWTLGPTAGDLLTSQTIGTGGGSIDLDDFTLNVPPGLFDADVALELYELIGVLPFDEDIITEAFRLEGLPDEYLQPLIPDTEYTGTLSDESFIVVGEELLITTLSTEAMAYHLFPASDASGFLTYSPPNGSRSVTTYDHSSRSNGNSTFLDFFGITGWATYKTDNNLRSNGTQGHFSIIYPKYFVDRADIEALGQYLEEAYTTYEKMGFSYGGRTDWPIKVVVTDLGPEVDGLFCKSLFGNNWATLQFNQRLLSNASDIRKTVGHEFFHFVQYLYDSRNNYSRGHDNAYSIALHWLDEAAAVWAEEKFSNIPNYVSPIRQGHEMAPFNGLHAGCMGNITSSGYHGYGMSAFIKYLVTQYGDSMLRDIYTHILDQKHPVEAINLATNYNLFMIWEPFLRKYVTGNIYNVSKASFIGNITGLFRIQSDVDRTKTFTKTYPDLSAKLFLIRLDYPEIDTAAAITLSIDQDVCDITVFRVNNAIEYLDHAPDKKLIIPDIRTLTDNGYDLLVMVTNSNHTEPYTNLTTIKLDIKVSMPGTVTVSSGSDKLVADGSTTTLITATVKDLDGNTVLDGTEVEFATTGGILSATTATTTNGEATVTLISPTTIGSAEVKASISTISGSVKVDFIAGPISSLILSSNPDTLPADGSSTGTIQIKTVDANANPVADASISITAVNGTLSASSATTDKNGIGTVVYTSPFTLPEGGTDTVTATAENSTSDTISITLKFNPIVTISASPQTGSQPLQVTALCTVSDNRWEVDHYNFYFGGNLVNSTDGTATFTFNTEGTYDIYCEVFGKDGMTVTSDTIDIAVGQTGINSYTQGLCPIPTGTNIHHETFDYGYEFYYKTDGNLYVKVGPEITYNQNTSLPTSLYCYVDKPLDQYFVYKDFGIAVEEWCASYSWWENGNMHILHHYDTYMKDGVLVVNANDGLSTEWWENGNKKAETRWHRDKKEGGYREWCQNGQIKTNGQYVNDKKSGLWTYWTCDGVRYRMETFSEDELDGYTAAFDLNTGNMLSEGHMQYIAAENYSFKVGMWTYWREDGSRESKGNYTYFADMGGSYEDGTWTYWFDNNNIWKTGSFKKGEKDGLWSYYYYTPDGELHSTERYSNGAVAERCHYIDNIVGNEWTCTTYEQ